MPITLDGTNGITTPMYNGSITANAVTPSVNMKNRIINGAMMIDQRNAGAAVTVNSGTNFFAVDRFAGFGESGDGVFTLQQSSVAPAGFINSLVATVTTADASVGASQYYFLTHRIEGTNCFDLGFGTASAKTVTLSFWVRSSLTGTFGGSLANSAFNRSYPFSYTISTANTWEQKTITIAGSWSASATYAPTGQTSVVGTNGATFYITGVQLEVGSTATSFDYRPYGTELALCQRYYVQFLGNSSYENLAGGMSSTNQNGYTVVALPVTMRSNPTLTYSTVSSTLRWTELANSFNGTAIAIDQSSTKTPQVYISVASGMTSYRAGFITANGTTSAYVGFSAEL